MYFKRTRTFQLLLTTFVLVVTLFATQFIEPALAQGKLIIDTITSPSLEGNLLGDSATKDLTIYLPPSYYDTSDKRYPVLKLCTHECGRFELPDCFASYLATPRNLRI